MLNSLSEEDNMHSLEGYAFVNLLPVVDSDQKHFLN
jgi:hypothetical protein